MVYIKGIENEVQKSNECYCATRRQAKELGNREEMKNETRSSLLDHSFSAFFLFFFFTILLLNRLRIKYCVGQNFGEVEFASKFGLPL